MRHPRETHQPLGHDAAIEHMMELYQRDHLPNGLMITGPRGIGKASLAYYFAKHWLCGEQGNLDSVSRRVTAGSHADLLVIEPVFDPKKGEYAREITVEQARSIGHFLSLTAAESRWRIVIIDSADILNTQAANAILKILEEPPAHAILLLVAHQPGLLLPTIRSRCQTLRLNPLTQLEFCDIIAEQFPDITQAQSAVLADLTGRAPGLAGEYIEKEALAGYAEIIEIVGELPSYPYAKIYAFAEKTVREQPHENWKIFTQLMLMLLSRTAKYAAGMEINGLAAAEQQALHIMANLRGPDYWAAKWAECADEFSVAERLHLDYKQVIIAFFHSINTEEGFHTGILAA